MSSGEVPFGMLNAPLVRMTDVSHRFVMNIYSQLGYTYIGHKHSMVMVTPFLVIKHPFPLEKLPCYRHNTL